MQSSTEIKLMYHKAKFHSHCYKQVGMCRSIIMNTLNEVIVTLETHTLSLCLCYIVPHEDCYPHPHIHLGDYIYRAPP